MDQIGRYEILNELGRGAMGVVYRARDTKIGREVAIKTIKFAEKADAAETSKLRERLFREAQSAGRLSHPGIVTIYDVAEEAGLAYITMEFVEGKTLQALMETGKARDLNFVSDVLRQTAAALDYAHSREIVHRDIKPANIMVTGDGTAKITDFGIARISSSTLTQTGTVMGTPSYMSPEQVRGDEIDGGSDQFSLGVITYELLTKEKPFSGDSLTSVMFKIVSGDVQRPREINQKISGELEEAIMRALAKSGKDRFGSCKDFAEAVCAGLQSSGDTVMTPVGPKVGAKKEPAVSEPEETAVAPPQGELETVVSPSAQQQTIPTVVAPGLPPLEAKPGTEPSGLEEPEERSRVPVWVAIAAVAGLLFAGTGYWLSQNTDFLGTPAEQADADTGSPDNDTLVTDGPQPADLNPADSPAGTAPDAAGGSGEQATTEPQPAAPESVDTRVADPPVVEPPPSPPPEPKAKVAPRPKAPPPPRELAVNFSSAQPGARAVVDGKPQWSCVTPCSLELPRGEHTVIASLSGFHLYRKTFEVGSKPLDVAFELEPVIGTLLVSSSPSGADIYVDGKKMEGQTNTSLQLPPGYRLIRVEKAGAGSAEQSVFIRQGQLSARQFVLTSSPARSKLSIKTTPPGAQIIINDTRRSWVTPEDLDLAPGSYRITLSLAGHRPVIKEIELKAGQSATLEEQLSPRN